MEHNFLLKFNFTALRALLKRLLKDSSPVSRSDTQFPVKVGSLAINALLSSVLEIF